MNMMFSFFLFLTTIDEDDQLIKEYQDIVNQYLSQAYFYATNSSIIHETYFSKYQSQIFAIKNDGFYFYTPNNTNNDSLEEFILKEKVATFPQVAAGNMYDLVLTKKLLLFMDLTNNNKKD